MIMNTPQPSAGDWLANHPKKRIAAKVLMRTSAGEVLLVKPSYKDVWQLPGGAVEEGESPQLAAVREIKEETDLTISESDLTIEGTIYRKELETVILLYVYKEALASDVDIKVDGSEVIDYGFFAQDEIMSKVSSDYHEVLKQILFQ
jgi:ADP-ribose pyrophosphatase YjhB (NUDIX family)